MSDVCQGECGKGWVGAGGLDLLETRPHPSHSRTLATRPPPLPARSALGALASAGVPVDASALVGLAPALDQLTSVAAEVEGGAAAFDPPPAATRALVQSAYAVPRTLLIAFEDDTIDETPDMAGVLRGISAAGEERGSEA